MKRHLNTLYVTTEGAYVHKDGTNIVVEADGVERARVPVHVLGGMVCFGRVSVSSPVMGFCAEEGVTITYLSQHGRFLARVEGPVAGNVLLRHDQHLCSENSSTATAIVRGIVAAKTAKISAQRCSELCATTVRPWNPKIAWLWIRLSLGCSISRDAP